MTSAVGVVHVALGERSYDIEIGTGNLVELGSFVAGRRRLTHAVVITDSQVEIPYAARVAESLSRLGATIDLLVIEPGEPSKSIDAAADLWAKLLDLGADRKSIVVALGGGVVGDLAGFVAATFARGLACIQVPTTLLAQVDSSVGGKVGVNLPGAKNMVGAFWQPLGVLIDTEVLDTLPAREYRAGLAEVVKYGVILDAAFFDWLEANVDTINRREPAALRQLITRCCQLKAEVVAGDEREQTGGRAVLNYGHTFAHALEAVAGYGSLLHGEAVAIGMVCAARLAERLGRIGAELGQRQTRLLTALGLDTSLPALDHGALLAAMQHDKKVEHGRLRFVLPDRLGHVELVDAVEPAAVEAVLSAN